MRIPDLLKSVKHTQPAIRKECLRIGKLMIHCNLFEKTTLFYSFIKLSNNFFLKVNKLLELS